MSDDNPMIQTIEQRQILLKKLRDANVIEHVLAGIIPCHTIPISGRTQRTWMCAHNKKCRFYNTTDIK